jgi:hypothetical protein
MLLIKLVYFLLKKKKIYLTDSRLGGGDGTIFL